MRALQAEHPGFLTALDGLIAEAEAAVKDSGRLPNLQSAFSGFLHKLHTHESEENRILLFGFGWPAMDTLST